MAGDIIVPYQRLLLLGRPEWTASFMVIIITLRKVGEAMSSYRCTSNHPTDSNHSKTSILQFRQLVFLELGGVCWFQSERIEGIIPGHPIVIIHVGQCGEGTGLHERDPTKDLDHRLGQCIVRINDPWDGLEGICLTGDTDEFRYDEPDCR